MFKSQKILREIVASGSDGVHESDLFQQYRVGRIRMRKLCRRWREQGWRVKFDPERMVYKEAL